MMEIVFFGFGCAQALGSATAEEPVRKESLRRLRSTSAAFCAAAEHGAVRVEEPAIRMGFAIPRNDQ